MRLRSLHRIMLACTLVIATACGDNLKGQQPTPDGSMQPDAPVTPDAPTDAPMANASEQIETARGTADGAGLSLPIEGATVTYLKPQIGSTTNDPAGFTIQAEQMGPAIFVAVDPATLTPPAAVGDVVSFTITELTTVGMQKRVAAISDYTRSSTGADVGALAQDISAATDLLTATESYDSELIDVTGTITGTFAFSGTGFVRAAITTTGISGESNYQLRIPETLRDALDIETGCMFTLNNVPVGRFNAQVQLPAFTASDITLMGCTAPVVVSASATSATNVRITFSRNILPSSVMANGSQFTFTGGLTASAATASGNTVDVTTSTQTTGTYTVTVASTVTDLAGTGVGTPNTADFPAFGSTSPSQQIADVLATPDNTGLSLLVEDVTVTYLKPQIGSTTNDPAGFTVQAAQTGPALFVAVDPATLTPPAAVGDVVSFTVTEVDTVNGQKRAVAITGYTRTSTGADVNALVQDITAATDVVSALDSYDSEVIDVAGTITGTFNGAGSGFQAAVIETTGITGNTGYLLRVPATLRTDLDIDTGCMFTLNNTPVGRFNAQVQLAAFTASDITLMGCPAPVVVSATATSATSVRVTFSRNILPGSVMANGSQFTFDNGLMAVAAVANGRTVDVVTTPQTGGTTYTVTVAGTVTDLQGTGVGAMNTATFAGFVVPAVVKINELNANIAGGCDLIELRVVTGGALGGLKLNERRGQTGSGELSVTFAPLVVTANTLIIVHVNGTPGTASTCNPGGAANETVVAGQPSATFTANYDTAIDIYAPDNSSGITDTDNVLTLFDAVGAIHDVVLLADDATTASAAAGSEAAAAAAAAANQWQIVGGGVPAGGFVDLDFRMHAVLDLDGTGTTAAGESIQRSDDTDDNDMADWTQAASSFGVMNAGQSLIVP